MDTGALYDSMKNSFDVGMPLLISHDRHRPAGWTVPAAVYLEPGLTRVLAHVIEPETDQDYLQIKQRWVKFIASTIHDVPQESITRLKELLGKDVLTDSEIPWDSGAQALRGAGLAQRAFPEIFEQVDKDGLVPFTTLTMIRPGIFQIGELCVFAHQFMRRSESPFNHFNEELLGTLHQMAQDSSVNVRVRLDLDMVGLADTAAHTMELDYWYGPTFNEDLSSLQTGVTAHTADESQRFYHKISRTEFWWQRRTKETSAELILEAEELRDSESGADRTKLHCRYVHSVIDATTNRIEHLDGSIRAYTPEEMISRLDVDLKRAGRQTEYTKLWRVDGNIEIGRWKSVIHNHFRDNALVSEYFGSQKSKTDIREELEITDVFPRSLNFDKRVPWLCDDARSFRVLVTHQPGMLEHILEEPVAFPYVWAQSEKSEYALFDLRAVELMKILGREGHRLTFAPNARFMAFDDNYLQMPVVIHRTRDALKHTTEAYRELVSKVNEVDPASPVLINLSLALSEYTLSVSIFGRCTEVLDWLNRDQPFPPTESVADWVRNTAEAIASFGEGVDTALEYVHPESLNLYPRRKIALLPAIADKIGEPVSSGPAEPRTTTEEMNEIGLETRQAFKVASAKCLNCGGDYLTCPCSILSGNVPPPTADLRFAFNYWVAAKQ
ncbi:hypothetical protein [Acidipila rosea]|nr:hypothetical protein [Acidipila rosea]